MNAIEVNDVKKVYGSGPAAFEALKGISFTIKKGESIAITRLLVKVVQVNLP